jgi:hypothetical protein
MTEYVRICDPVFDKKTRGLAERNEEVELLAASWDHNLSKLRSFSYFEGASDFEPPSLA